MCIRDRPTSEYAALVLRQPVDVPIRIAGRVRPAVMAVPSARRLSHHSFQQSLLVRHATSLGVIIRLLDEGGVVRHCQVNIPNRSLRINVIPILLEPRRKTLTFPEPGIKLENTRSPGCILPPAVA